MTVGDSGVCTDKTPFTEINLSDIEKKKLPKRLVYFSDGVLEEYSTDEEEMDGVNPDTQPLIDPKTLSWMPYFGYLIWWLGSRTLAVCDYLGENLAWLLGITSPKFQYELDQYERMLQEDEELRKYIESENAGWTADYSEKLKVPVDTQPQALSDETVMQNEDCQVENNVKEQQLVVPLELASKF